MADCWNSLGSLAVLTVSSDIRAGVDTVLALGEVCNKNVLDISVAFTVSMELANFE